ncbi:hypothetical protein [Streptomyces mirabilis]|uniref:hypothetical protein n=1 Tax=Streptomyces mirabilis TaxID=68239 RepID=UPI0033BE3DCB
MLALAIGGVTDQAIHPMMIVVQVPCGITSHVFGAVELLLRPRAAQVAGVMNDYR